MAVEKSERRLEKRRFLGLPRYSLGEEIFSAVSHGVSALFAVAALVLLLVFCEKRAINVVSVSIYGATMILLYTVSTLYHALGLNKAKVVFRSLDHCTIFLLIAGTYTPITLVCLGGAWGWSLFGVVWGAAVLGVGLCYTAGAILYGVGKKIPYIHSVFHLFVLAGSVLHTICVAQICC